MTTQDIQPMHQSAEIGVETPVVIVNPGDFVRGLGIVTDIRWISQSKVWLLSAKSSRLYREGDTVIVDTTAAAKASQP